MTTKIPRKKQSLKRAMTKAAARVVVYRATNHLLDTMLNFISDALEEATEKKKTLTKK